MVLIDSIIEAELEEVGSSRKWGSIIPVPSSCWVLLSLTHYEVCPRKQAGVCEFRVYPSQNECV